MKTKFTITVTVLFILLFQIGFCQKTDAEKLKELYDWKEKQDKNIFKFGISLGVRTGFCSENSGRAVVTILPNSNKVSIDHEDLMAFLISTSLTVFPFEGDFNRFGFTANINLLEFTSAQSNSTFNKPIDGGIGFAYALDKNKKFAVAVTYERTSNRKPKDWVINSEGSQIIVNGQPVTSINKNDDQYYMNTGLNAISLKFIYHFN